MKLKVVKVEPVVTTLDPDAPSVSALALPTVATGLTDAKWVTAIADVIKLEKPEMTRMMNMPMTA